MIAINEYMSESRPYYQLDVFDCWPNPRNRHCFDVTAGFRPQISANLAGEPPTDLKKCGM